MDKSRFELLNVLNGLWAKRSSGLMAPQRVSTCDSRYTQTPDWYLDRLSDNEP